MNTLREYLLPALTIIGGGGVVYYLLSLRDTTPVGLTTTKKHETGVIDDTDVSFEFVDGTYRESESSLPLHSTADKVLLVLYQDGEIVEADLVSLTDYSPLKTTGDNEDDLRRMKNWKAIADRYGGSETLDNGIAQLEETNESNAEMILRPTNTLQSHFVW